MPQSSLPAGLSSADSLLNNVHAPSSEFANVNEQSPQSEDMGVIGNNEQEAIVGEADEEDDENNDEEDDDDGDDGDDGAFGEISEQDGEDDDEAEEEQADISQDDSNTPMINNGQSSTRPSLANGAGSSELLNRRGRDSHDVAFDAEMDPDLYGLRRSVGVFPGLYSLSSAVH